MHIIAILRDALKETRNLYYHHTVLNSSGDIQNELWLSCIATCDETLTEEQQYQLRRYYDDTIQC